MIDKGNFSKLLLDTQVQYLRKEGKHVISIDRLDQPVTLYALGKRFYEVIYTNYQDNNIARIDEINLENVMSIYFNQL